MKSLNSVPVHKQEWADAAQPCPHAAQPCPHAVFKMGGMKGGEGSTSLGFGQSVWRWGGEVGELEPPTSGVLQSIPPTPPKYRKVCLVIGKGGYRNS